MSESKRIAVIGGDGIGPEVTSVALRVLQHFVRRGELPFVFEELPYGSEHYLQTGIGLPREERLRIGRDYDGVLLGAVGDPRVPDNLPGREIVLGLRFDLDLYINLRPTALVDASVCPLKDKGPDEVHFTIFRENTEGIYGGLGGQHHRETPHEVATATMLATTRGVDRILRAALEFASKQPQKLLTFVHKKNAIPQLFGLWWRRYQVLKAEFPEVEATDMLVDRAAMELVRAPEQFETLVTSNLLGDILTDLAAQLAGGMGLAASANIHPGQMVLVEPVHGSAPDIAGQGRANPMAAMLSAALLSEHLGFPGPAATIEAAVAEAVRRGHTTPDLGGDLSTEAVGNAVLELIAR